MLIFSDDIRKHFKSLLIDEARKHVLTRITNTKRGAVKKESDHNALVAEFDLKVDDPDLKNKSEAYNLKNVECQKKFYKYTTDTKMLSSIFNTEDDINVLTQRVIKKIDGCIKMCFRKVRVNKEKETEEEKLYKKLRLLKDKTEEGSKEALDEVTEAIAKLAEAKYKQVIEELNKMKPEEGRKESHKFWQMKKKLFPKSREPPSAMLDSDGVILTTNKAIERRALEAYTERLKPN